MLKQNPGRASLFEELIHATQYRNGENDGSYVSRLNCEIKAQKKLLRNNKSYKLTEAEVEQTKIALQQYESELKAYNDPAVNRIETAVDLATIMDIAMNQLGMSYAGPDQIIHYTVDKEDYMNQFEDIPNK